MDPIDNNGNLKPLRSGTEQRTSSAETPVRGKGAAGSGPVPSGDAVTITRTATDLLQLEKQLAALPEADLERVESIRAAIGNGSYQVDVERIVSNLLQAEQDLS